jgi:UDP-glucose 4-epimerase
MRAIVTGGAGFIGSHLSERLHGEGHEVLIVDDLSSGSTRLPILESIGLTVDTTDVREEEFIKTAQDFRPDTIFHLAAQIDVRRSTANPILDADINVLGTLRVLEAARLSKARIVFASSGGTIYGDVDPEAFPVAETAQGRPTSPYGISKRVSEDYLRFYGDMHDLPFVSLALGNVFGPRQDPHGEAGVVAIFTSRLLRGEGCVIYGDGKQTRDFVYVDDVADAFLAATTKGTAETFNIATGTETSVIDLYTALAGICGVARDPKFESERPGEVDRSCLDVSKARASLGWEPKTSFHQGLKHTVEAFRQDPGGAA